MALALPTFALVIGGGQKRFTLPDGDLFGIAAITTTSRQDDGDMLTYAMVTRDAVEEAATVHPRMPLILPRELHDDWLDPTIPGDGDRPFISWNQHPGP